MLFSTHVIRVVRPTLQHAWLWGAWLWGASVMLALASDGGAGATEPPATESGTQADAVLVKDVDSADTLDKSPDTGTPDTGTPDADTPDAKISFELDVLPVLTAHGCNMGACHGKQRGQNGFQLSLLAFDPDFDFAALTQDARGRRLFPAAARKSLLLEKAVASLPHGGGKRFETDSEPYRVLLSWIEQGATRKVAGEPRIESVALEQADFSLVPEQSRNLRVVARYTDGTSRNVTSLSTYLSKIQQWYPSMIRAF